MRRRLPTIFTVALIAAILRAGNALAGEPGWTSVDPALVNETTGSTLVNDIAAISRTDIWAVASAWGDGPSTLIAHWAGDSWSLSEAPNVANFEYTLQAVDAVSEQDVWAVGYGTSLPTPMPAEIGAVFTHYDGSGWSTSFVTAPAPANSYVLSDVDMVSAADGWAVGNRAGPMSAGLEGFQPLVMRWQSGQWSAVALPHIDGGNAAFEAVHARAGNDVWAVGYQGASSLVMHFDGSQWSRVIVPHGLEPDRENQLRAVVSAPGGDVWAAGTACVWMEWHASCLPLVLRLSAGAWSVVPTAADSGTHIIDIAARSDDDIWLVGYDGPAGAQEANHIEHWNGQGFTTVGVERFGLMSSLASALTAVTVIPDTGELWAVGWLGTSAQVIRHD